MGSFPRRLGAGPGVLSTYLSSLLFGRQNFQMAKLKQLVMSLMAFIQKKTMYRLEEHIASQAGSTVWRCWGKVKFKEL